MAIRDYFKNLFSLSIRLEPKNKENLSGIEKADTIFYNLVAEKKVPGISVTILKKGATLLQKGYGHANLERKVSVNPKNTIFRIASISKCITALAFGKMIEEGLLNWDDSFYKYVPYFPKKEYDFTLRQLASHTAGIRGYLGKEFALNKPYSIKESIEVFKNDPLVFKPGQGYLYNSFDFVLLSLAMQEASGIPFEDYVKEEVLVPLGMNSTCSPPCRAEHFDKLDTGSVEASDRMVPKRLRQAQSDIRFYTKTVKGFKKAAEVNNFYKLAGGGYLSTSDDVAKLGQAILERKLLQNETYDQLLTAQTLKGKSTYYGLGFQVSADTQGRPFVGHVGSSVGAYSNLFVYPQEQTVISILINCTDPKVQDVLDEAVHAVLEEAIT